MDLNEQNQQPEDDALWRSLDAHKDIEPTPGYQSRFWTRVANEQPQPWLERAAQWLKGLVASPVFAPSAVAFCIVFAVAVRIAVPLLSPEGQIARLDEEEVQMLAMLDLVEDIDVLQDMDILEDWEIIEALENSDA